ncbi:MAG: PD40 domain-containing protein [Gemmatimonadota bacterium]|nr:MAG: PD40 domain-containing protein [Gemmatimonadota bacterium]
MKHSTTHWRFPIAASLVLIVEAGCASSDDFPVLTGDYLGQTPPGPTPQLFAPGIVSTGVYTRDLAMTPEGDEIYFGVMVGGFSTIMVTERVNGRWTKPEVAPFAADPQHLNLEPAISPDGQKFYFLSNRPRDGGAMDPADVGRWVNQDIWVMDRTAAGWSEPYNLGPPVNSAAAEYFPSVTADGTIYFTRQDPESQASLIHRSRLVAGEYQEVELLGPEVNSTAGQFNAYVAPDESYLMVGVAGRDDSFGGTDYYISFRDESDNWTGPINMGELVNTPRGGEWSPYVSPDGRYFFFMSTRFRSADQFPDALTADYLHDVHAQPLSGNPGIYWMEAGFIEELRQAAEF